jgi:alcohol dehydrogenase class IV
MMLASLYAGLAFSNASLGCVHSMAHSLGGYLDLAHGECNAILLPHVVDFNMNSSIDRYKKIAEVMSLPVACLSPKQFKKYLINHLIELRKALNITATLSNKGVQTDITPILASKAINDPCNATNPTPPTKSDLIAIYNEAI